MAEPRIENDDVYIRLYEVLAYVYAPGRALAELSLEDVMTMEVTLVRELLGPQHYATFSNLVTVNAENHLRLGAQSEAFREAYHRLHQQLTRLWHTRIAETGHNARGDLICDLDFFIDVANVRRGPSTADMNAFVNFPTHLVLAGRPLEARDMFPVRERIADHADEMQRRADLRIEENLQNDIAQAAAVAGERMGDNLFNQPQ